MQLSIGIRSKNRTWAGAGAEETGKETRQHQDKEQKLEPKLKQEQSSSRNRPVRNLSGEQQEKEKNLEQKRRRSRAGEQ